MITAGSCFDSTQSVRTPFNDKENSLTFPGKEKERVVAIATKIQELEERPLKKQKVLQEKNSLEKRSVSPIRMVPEGLKTSSSDSSLEIEKQEQWFASQSPKQWYPLQRGSEEHIQIALPVSLRKVKRLIYIFRNREQERFLIGKTATSLNKRCSRYATHFNEKGSEKRAKGEGRKAFLTDIKKHPEDFDVAILYILKPKEKDLDFFETRFIQAYGAMYSLYNDNKGGGGGWAHTDEAQSIYAIPKPETVPFTPEKYYPYRRDTKGGIRPQLSPGFKRKISEYKEQLDETQELLYVIKKMDTQERYVGVSDNPLRRSNEHAYAAEYYDPDHEKYDPTRKSGRLHPAMAKNPEQFAIGLLPICSFESVDPKKHEDYISLMGIAKVERYAIEVKQSLFSQNGFNSNRGGRGPIARQATVLTRRKLF